MISLILVLIILLIIFYDNKIFDNEPLKFLITAIITLVGLIIQILVVVVAFRYGLEANEIKNQQIRNEIFNSLELTFRNYNFEIESNKKDDFDVINLFVKNKSNYTIEDCVGYITIKDEKYEFYMPEESFPLMAHSRVNEEKLCWASCENDIHGPRINIYSGEKQDLCFCRNNRKFTDSRHTKHYDFTIEIPSERGYTNKINETSRCLIENNRNYTFEISLVAKNMKRKNFIINYNYTSEDKSKFVINNI